MKLLLVGPSKDIQNFNKEYFDTKIKEGYTVVSYSNSLSHFLEIGVDPHFWSFLDPFSLRLYFEQMEKGLFANVKLLTADIYDNDLNTMKSIGYVAKNIERNKKLKAKLNDIILDKHFAEHIRLPYQVQHEKDITANKTLLDSPLVLMRPQKERNQCKFTTFLFPLIVNYFDNIEQITIIGFGHYKVGRFIDDQARSGYKDYSTSYQRHKQQLIDYISQNNIKVNIEGADSLFHELKTQ